MLLIENTRSGVVFLGSVRLQVMLASAEEKRAQADKMADQVGGPSYQLCAILSQRLVGPSRFCSRA